MAISSNSITPFQKSDVLALSERHSKKHASEDPLNIKCLSAIRKIKQELKETQRSIKISINAQEDSKKINTALKVCAVAALTSVIAAPILLLSLPLGITLIAASASLFFAGTMKILATLSCNSSHPIAKAIRIADGIILDIQSAVLAGISKTYEKTQFNPTPCTPLTGRPIILLNGYLGDGSNFSYLKKHLLNAGFGPIYPANLGSFDSIETYARQIQRQVKKIQEETKRKDIQLICHSKGGLVGTYYATHFASEDQAKITSLITIGTPFAGTPVANFGIGKDATEMLPNHPFNENLRREIAKHPEIPIFCIASESDPIVPVQSAISGTTHPSRRKIFRDLGHLSLLFSPKVAEQVCTHLRPVCPKADRVQHIYRS